MTEGGQKTPGGTTFHPMMVEQESMWLDDHLRDGPSRYLESWVYHLRGPLDRDAVRWALERIVARHEALRSRFLLCDDRLLQEVLPEGRRLELETVACSPECVEDTLKELVRRPLDLAENPLRATLVDVSAETAVLVLQLHHLVIDDSALHTIEREFEEHYRAHVERRLATVAPVTLQPGAYAAAQRSAPRDPEARAYWREALRDLPDDVARTLAADGAGAPDDLSGVRSDRGDRIAFDVDAVMTNRVRTVCRRVRVTPFAVFASVVAVLLHSVRGAREVIVGIPVSRRDTADCHQMVAPLGELLPLRLAVSPDVSFAGLLGHVRDRIHEALTHKDISYGEVLAMARQHGRPGDRYLCRTVLVVDDAQPSRIELPGVEARRVLVHSGVSKYDLTFTFVAQGRGYLGFLEYPLDLFDAEAAGRVLEGFAALLERACDNPDRAVSQLTDAVVRGVPQ